MSEIKTRKSIRLKDYDYNQSDAYFVTICVRDRREILSSIDVGERIARLSDIGLMVESAIL